THDKVGNRRRLTFFLPSSNHESTGGSGFLPTEKRKKKMGGFDLQVKERTKELKHLKAAAMRGIKAAGESCKKAWSKVRSSIRR
uniref:Uncharacterized protein n=3 Tax=Setaria TaxID=4554 RepID=K3YEN1_SETIT